MALGPHAPAPFGGVAYLRAPHRLYPTTCGNAAHITSSRLASGMW